MRGDPPLVTMSILDAPGTVSIELVRRLSQRGCAGLERSLVGRIHIFSVDVDHGGKCWELRVRIAQHYDRVADSQLGMDYSTITTLVHFLFIGVEHFFEKVNQSRCSLDNHYRCKAMIAVR